VVALRMVVCGRVCGARVVAASVLSPLPSVFQLQRHVLQPNESKNHSGWLKSGLQKHARGAGHR
jgi:hypothetical protein